MPKLSGIFAQFNNLDQILAEDVIKLVKQTASAQVIQDFIANRMLYPQAVPVTIPDMQLDEAILQEAIKRDKSYISKVSQKIFIPQQFLQRFPNLLKLVTIFVDSFSSELKKGNEIWQVLFKKDTGTQVLGSYILPKTLGLAVNLKGVDIKIEKGSLLVLRCPKSHCQLNFRVSEGKFLGRGEGTVEVFGGPLGILVDGRSLP